MSIRSSSVKLYQEGEKGKEKGKRKGRGREREESRTSDLMGQYVRTRRQVAQWWAHDMFLDMQHSSWPAVLRA